MMAVAHTNAHNSPRSNEALERCKFFNGKLFELRLPLMRTFAGKVEAERVATRAAAKIKQRRNVEIVDVWQEEGSDAGGPYQVYFILTAPNPIARA